MSLDAPQAQASLRRARVFAATLLASGLAVAAAAVTVGPRGDGPVWLALGAALGGLAAAPAAWRWSSVIAERIAPHASLDARCRAFEQSHLLPLALTDAAALAGAIAYVLTGRAEALTGVAVHLLIAGALWPTPARLAGFLDR